VGLGAGALRCAAAGAFGEAPRGAARGDLDAVGFGGAWLDPSNRVLDEPPAFVAELPS
jgi:hypothetical protein